MSAGSAGSAGGAGGAGGNGIGNDGIDGGRLWERIKRLARIGAQPASRGGGISRPAFGPAAEEAALLVARWMREAGLEVGADETGNLIGIWPGSEPGRPALALGSHLDTVPNGGAFDGALGVLAALEAVEALAKRGERLRSPLAVIAFADEEGNSFGIGALSAQLWTGEIEPERFAEVTDPAGRGLDSYLESFRLPGIARVARPKLAAYLEAHVEQGPVLHSQGSSAAAVEAIVGISRLTVEFAGEANHSGTTPMPLRRDALLGAAELTLFAERLAHAQEGRAVATVGVLEVSPGATNVIAGHARLRVELRSPEEERLQTMRTAIEQEAGACAKRRGLALTLGQWHHAPAVPMHPLALEAIRGTMAAAGLAALTVPSWAGHDAKIMARHMPVGMIFVPSVAGLSHAPNEATSAADCALAAQLLQGTVRRLDRQSSLAPRVTGAAVTR